MTIRQIAFSVAASGAVSPALPQYGGVKGEHNETALCFSVDAALVTANDVMRLAFTGGDGAILSSDLIEDYEQTAEVITFSYLLPQILTLPAGQLCARVVVSRFDDDGNEIEIFRSNEAVVWFDEAEVENGTPFWTGVSEMLRRTVTAKDTAVEAQVQAQTERRYAQAAAANAKTYVDEMRPAAIRVMNALSDAEKARSEAQAKAQAADEAAKEAHSAASAAETAVENAVAAKFTAQAHSNAARQAAQAAAEAVSRAETLEDSCARFTSAANGYADAANTSADAASTYAQEAKDARDSVASPHIGENGNWYVGTTNTGVKAIGDDGVGIASITPIKDGATDKVVGMLVRTTDGASYEVDIPDGEKGDKGDTYTLTDDDKAEIAALAAIQIKDGGIIGVVDEDNNILLSGNIANGTYVLKYENEDGTYSEIGTLDVGTVEPTYTNFANPSDANWKENTRINSSYAETTAGGVTTTNYIEAKNGDVIRIKNMELNHGAYDRIIQYNGDGGTAVNAINPSATTNADKFVVVDGVTTYTLQGVESGTHIRVCGYLTGSSKDVIITINEEIA